MNALNAIAAHQPWTEGKAESVRSAAVREIERRARRLRWTFQCCTAIAALFFGLGGLAHAGEVQMPVLLLLGAGAAFAIPAIQTATKQSHKDTLIRRWEIENGFLPLTERQMSLLLSTTAHGSDAASHATRTWLSMGYSLRQRDLEPLRKARQIEGLSFPEWVIDEVSYVIEGRTDLTEATPA